MKLIPLVITALFIPSLTWSAPIADPGSRGIDWDQVKQKVKTRGWAASIVKRVQKDVLKTISLYDEPPLGTTGWLHEYYCEADARRLTFDPQKPHEHTCPKCGHIYSGAPYDDCWRSLVHGAIASAAQQSAVLFRITGEREWFDYTKKILLWYATHFEQFQPHGSHSGQGIIREQSLDESTQLVDFVHAYWDVCPSLTEEERQQITEKFLLPDAQFIHRQTHQIHNIHSWHNAAVGLTGFVTGNRELIAQAIDGEFGLKNQIQKGILEDGFWYEGSISYHFYAISSLEPLYTVARAQKYPLEGTEKLLRMYTSPTQFAFASGEFPAVNDGWPGQSLNEKDSYYEIACSLWNDPLLPQTLANMYSEQKRTSIEALLYGPIELPPNKPLPSPSILFQDSGIAILRNSQLNAFLKFGPYGGGHDHLDRLNFILYAAGQVILPDLGTSGYGISLNSWYESPAAHNLLIVDGKKQKKCGGYLIDYQDNSVSAGVKEAYKDVDIQRTLSLLDNGIQDVLRIQAEKSHQYDLIYHIRGVFDSGSVSLQNIESLGDSNGYKYLKNIRTGKCKSDDPIKFSWTLRDVPGTLNLQCSSPQDFEVYLGTCPDNPADKEMSFILLRSKSPYMEWKSLFEIAANR